MCFFCSFILLPSDGKTFQFAYKNTEKYPISPFGDVDQLCTNHHLNGAVFVINFIFLVFRFIPFRESHSRKFFPALPPLVWVLLNTLYILYSQILLCTNCICVNFYFQKAVKHLLSSFETKTVHKAGDLSKLFYCF